MPTYEYRCKSCGYEFEELESMSAEPLVVCPKCAKTTLKRLMSGGAGLLFKGSGFYLTDYKKTNTSGATPDKKPAPKTDTKTDSKPSSEKTSTPDKK